MASAIDEYLDRLKRLLGAGTDAELAARLRKAKQTISSWRRRGAVPHKEEMALAELYGPDAAFSEYARHVYSARERRVLQAVFLTLFEQDRKHLDPRQDASFYLVWADLFASVEDELRGTLRDNGFVRLHEDETVSIEEESALVAFLIALLRAGKIASYNDASLVLAHDPRWTP
jgi:hypothetical protein